MGLDLFATSIRNGDEEVARNAARDLPAGFAEAYTTSLHYGGYWQSGVAYNQAREAAIASYVTDIKDRTGADLPPLEQGGRFLDDFNEKQAKVAAEHPELELQPLTEQSMDAMALRRMAKAHSDQAALSAREKTWGGTFGGVAGALQAGIADPTQLPLLLLGGSGEAGVALRALEFAGIAGGSAATTAALSYRERAAAVPGSSKEIPGEIAGATLFGAVLGGSLGLLGKLLEAGAKPLPTALRDDVNAGASQAQMDASNIFPGAAGETANHDAVLETIRSILKGEPVKAGDGFDQAHVAGLKVGGTAPDGTVRFYHGGESPTSGGPRWLTPYYQYARDFRAMAEPNEVHYVDIPKSALESDPALASGFDEINGKYRNFEAPESIAKQLKPVEARDADAIAAAADAHLRPVTRDVAPDVERYERVPDAGESASDYWERRLESATPEERAALGATDDLARDTPTPNPSPQGGGERIPQVAAADLGPEAVARLAAEPATDDAVARNLDRLRLADMERDYTETVTQADGSVQMVTRKLEDVLDEIDGYERAGKELLACVTGAEAA